MLPFGLFGLFGLGICEHPSPLSKLWENLLMLAETGEAENRESSIRCRCTSGCTLTHGFLMPLGVV